MQKISTTSTNKLLISFIIKSVITTALSIVLLSLISGKIVHILDLNTSIIKYISIGICAITSAIISYISVSGIKNNVEIMGIISEIPLIVFSFINLLFHNHNFLFFFIKIVLIVLIGAIFGALSKGKHSKTKVKKWLK